MSSKAAELVRQIFLTLRPPEDLLLADWMTKNITLPEGKSVRPGPMENWPYMTEILNAMGDRGVERVTVRNRRASDTRQGSWACSRRRPP
jgi:phage terminase large subunit GpA-like protein